MVQDPKVGLENTPRITPGSLMTPHPPAIRGDGFAVRLAAFYAGHFTALGIHMPFLPVWLAAKGLDANAIGLVLAAPFVLRIVVVPLAAGLADRFHVLRGVLMVVAFMALVAYAAVGLASGFVAILISVSIASALFTSVFPLADAYALKGLAARGRAYGPIRLWGSAAFIAGSIGAGAIADRIAPVHLIWLIVAALALMALTAVGLRPLPHSGAAPSGRRAGLAFLLSPRFLLVTAAASLIQASHALLYGFATLAWSAAGLDGQAIGALWALSVVAEIVAFAVSGRLLQPLGATALLLLGAAGAVLRWGLMALDPPAAVLPFAQSLHGLSFAATHLGSMLFLARAAAGGMGATAQGTFTLAMGFVMAGAMTASGRLYEAYGIRAYAAMAVAALVGGALAFAAHRLRLRP
jgi:PPP family 3-phenylpropionic acid transporter